MGDVYMASIDGDIDKLRQYVEYEGQSVTTRDACGASPLHWASRQNHAHLIPYIVLQGGDVSAVDKDGRTALHWAASKGATAAADLLLQNGAWVEAADNWGLRIYEEKRIEDHLTSFSRLGEDEFLRENVRRPSTSTKIFSPSYATNYATDSLSHAIMLGQGRYERIDMHPLYIKVVPANILDAYKQENHNESFLELTSIANTRHPIKSVGAGNGLSVPELVPDRTEEDSLKNIKRQMLTRLIYGIFSALNGMFTEKPTPSVTGDVKPDTFHPLANNYFGDKLAELGLGCILPKPNPVRMTNNNDPLHSLGVTILRALTGKALGAIKNLILARSRKWLILKLVIGAVMWLRKGV